MPWAIRHEVRRRTFRKTAEISDRAPRMRRTGRRLRRSVLPGPWEVTIRRATGKDAVGPPGGRSLLRGQCGYNDLNALRRMSFVDPRVSGLTGTKLPVPVRSRSIKSKPEDYDE